MEGTEDCCVKVAVHIRPLIGDERLQGCKDCVTVVQGKPQVQIGTHSFTFDHVYGSSGSSSSAMFQECVAPLVDGLFQGYNATVLAYGQTGSGKTYTMGTGFRDGFQTGLIPQVMNALFSKIESFKHQTEFQLHVSFIEILKEEVQDLLDPTSAVKSDTPNGHGTKVTVPGKPPIQIRETSNGVITLAGSTEVAVCSLKEMAACLEQGSLSRATGSTNMNNQSSRSHAIFTITLEQMRKVSPVSPGINCQNEDISEEYLCAKLHLVDLAGSERAKRTGSDGLRFKEGVHINKGLLALGNVISALGDEKKRKEGAHVPYRDSKLTRLLQDSLGGNSRTVMIGIVSLVLCQFCFYSVRILTSQIWSCGAFSKKQFKPFGIVLICIIIDDLFALQLRKEGRRNEYERHKLQALNQRQKMVLQRKTEEAAMVTKRLKELLEARKSTSRDSSVTSNGSVPSGQSNEKSLQRWLDHELEVMVNVHEVRSEYEKQSQVRAALAEELAVLKQVDECAARGLSPPGGKNGYSRVSSMSPNARMARIASLENMLSISSNTLVTMASQLSEAEERDRAFSGRGRWNQLRSMADAKSLLQYMFNAAADARCQLWEKEIEMKEMKEQLNELVGLLRQSEARRKEIEKQQKLREQAVAIALATSASGNSHGSLKHFADDMSGPLSPMSVPAQKQLKYTAGIANGSVRDSAAFMDQTRKMIPIGQLSVKKMAAVGQAGKLWRWKRSHHQWLLQFKWKWQKPWRLSEWIRHSDETIVRARPRQQVLSGMI
ncbi:kinesin-like protein KIN-4A [Macadamia integrifolia]|uniref:kinesin-like protein KIN-4A n=1 Tax=Macadamia integrifolia TaxID=60698 RepID=UPI001C4FA3FC|nr:kinesin-like protein KIN-4A [Macadamia integrifolia]